MYYTYILRCKDNSLYTGITTDLKRRAREHSQGIGSKYTHVHGFKKIECAWSSDNRSFASQLEYKIKQLDKQAKESLIISDNEIIDSTIYKRIEVG